jgi:hypothetical protein
MFDTPKNVHLRQAVSWLFDSNVGCALIVLLAAFLIHSMSFGIIATGLLLSGSTDYIDRQRRLLRRLISVAGMALVVAGAYVQFTT